MDGRFASSRLDEALNGHNNVAENGVPTFQQGH
jgi:hypothetical protein